MNDELVVIFVNTAQSLTECYLNSFGITKSVLNKDEVVGLKYNSLLKYVSPMEAQQPDVLFFIDYEINKNKLEKVLDLEARNKKNVFVCYHAGSDFLDNQRQKISEICLGLVMATIQHSNAGSVFNALIAFGNSFKISDHQGYSAGLQNLCLSIGDEAAEAKLNLLHQCLTRKGAKELVESKNLSTLGSINVFWEEKIVKIPKTNILDISEKWEISDAVKLLAGEAVINKPDFKVDENSEDYRQILSSLRQALLG